MATTFGVVPSINTNAQVWLKILTKEELVLCGNLVKMLFRESLCVSAKMKNRIFAH
jgi:hypothetical protein